MEQKWPDSELAGTLAKRSLGSYKPTMALRDHWHDYLRRRARRRSLGRFSTEELHELLEARSDTIWLPPVKGPTPARQEELRRERRERLELIAIRIVVFIIVMIIAMVLLRIRG